MGLMPYALKAVAMPQSERVRPLSFGACAVQALGFRVSVLRRTLGDTGPLLNTRTRKPEKNLNPQLLNPKTPKPRKPAP